MSALLKCCGGMFVYGFARSLRCNYAKDLPFSTRLLCATGNGIYYGCTIIIPIGHLSSRMLIHVRGMDPSNYPDEYQELNGMNHNVIL